MNETLVTLVGNVVTDVMSGSTSSGIENAHFRFATTTRRFDRGVGQWVDGDTSYVRVTCWRRLARHVAQSVAKGHPVVVHGRLKVREWSGEDGRRMTSVEVDALSVGHDLSRGITQFSRPARREPMPDESGTKGWSGEAATGSPTPDEDHAAAAAA